MSASVNKVVIVGNLGKDPEVRYTAGGQAVCNISVATSRAWTDKQSGQKKEETEWHAITCFGKTAEAVGQYLTKGSSVYVEGRLKTEKWQDKQTGVDKYKTGIVAEDVKFLGGKGAGSGAGQERKGAPAAEAPADPVDDDSIPF